MNERIKELAKQVGIFFGGHPMNPLSVYPSELERFAELIREDEREAIIRILKQLSPEIVGKANDPDTHEQWCYSAVQFSRFQSVISAIRARSKT